MGLLDDIRQDIIDITTDIDNGFGVELTFEAPTGETATVIGIASKHHTAISSETGQPVNTKMAHVSVAEKLFVEYLPTAYPVRNAKGLVSMADHKVSYADSTGFVAKYVIREWFPDETVGLIVCKLGAFV